MLLEQQTPLNQQKKSVKTTQGQTGGGNKMSEKLYRCIEDLQGGTFAVGGVETAQGWLERAIDWQDADDSWDTDENRTRWIKYWKEEIKNGNEDKLIDYIAEVWDIVIVPTDTKDMLTEEERDRLIKAIENVSN